jgi:hypothetical protein
MRRILLLFGCISLVPCTAGFTETPAVIAFRSSHSASSSLRRPSSSSSRSSYSSRRSRHCSLILPPSSPRLRRLRRLTTTPSSDDLEAVPQSSGPLQHAMQKFRARPGTYLMIPCVAAVVGWFTNWLAVQMIFYPIQFRGIPIKQWNEIPFGLLGWQGIVPCKTRPMSEAMCEMVTSQLISVKEIFGRLDPKEVSKLLAPRMPVIMKEVLREIMPLRWMVGVPGAIFNGLDTVSQGVLKVFNHQFLTQLTKAMQTNIDDIFSLSNWCVVTDGSFFIIVGRRLLSTQ